MKEKVLYTCEACRTDCTDKAEAKRCEESHKKKLKAVDPGYSVCFLGGSDFPIIITAQSEDGAMSREGKMDAKSEFYRLVENDVKMLDALVARIESRRAEAHKALAGMPACEDPIKEEKYGFMAADALGSAASTCVDFYAAVMMMAELATARDALPKGAKLTRTILQRSIAHAVKNAQDAVVALSASAASDRTKIVIDDFRKAFLDAEEGEK